MNTTKLLKSITKMADENNIKIKNVEIYSEAVEINEKVKVKILPNQYFLVENKLGVANAFEYESTMLIQVLLYLQTLIDSGDLVGYKEKEYKIIRLKHYDKYYFLDVEDNTFNLEDVLSYEQLQENILDKTFTKIKEDEVLQ